ncbi:MAG TPA: FHA domain-containing protein [Pirellulales bacterium]|nr:FHA domain-containing protein [Pirellulales bacterium]
MDVKFVVVGGGPIQSNEFALQLPTVVGRSRTADLPLANPLVSRKHCEVFEAEGVLMVRDLGSLNGTFIGKTRIEEPSPIPPGGMLTIGAITFRADYVGANGAATAAEPQKSSGQLDSSDATVDVEGLETLEPLAEAPGGSDGEFNLAWLEEETSQPLADSIGANGAEPAAAAKKTVAGKDAAKASTQQKGAGATKGKAAAPEAKSASAASSDSLDDLL